MEDSPVVYIIENNLMDFSLKVVEYTEAGYKLDTDDSPPRVVAFSYTACMLKPDAVGEAEKPSKKTKK